jgi:hypothetical protein
MEFDIGRFTRKCAATDRELQPGDVYYSVLVPAGAKVERRDYLASAWTGAPEQALCWWRAEMPTAQGRQMTWAPQEAVLDYFHQLQAREDAADELYVLALWMVRRRIVRWDETRHDELGRELLCLYCAATDSELHVPVVEPLPERLVEIETTLAQLLFSPASY